MSYIPGLSEELSSQLKYFVPEVKIAPKPPQKLDQFYSKLKQPIGKEDMSGVVYDITCKAQDIRYIGETVQKLKKRTYQHKNDCSPTNLAKKVKKRTALAQHAKDEKHEFDFDLDNVKILKRERNKTRLRIQEVNEIVMAGESVCNYKSDSLVIRPAYGQLLKQFKAKSASKQNQQNNQHRRRHFANGFGNSSQ